MIVFLIKASLVILVLIAFYKFFLEKESFFTANRIYLIGCLTFAGTLPFVVLPQLLEHQGFFSTLIESPEKAEIALLQEDLISDDVATIPEKKTAADLQTLQEKTYPSSDKAHSEKQTVQTERTLETQTLGSKNQEGKGFSFWLVLIYFFGVGVLSINLIAQIANILWKVFKNNDQIEDEGSVIVNMNGAIAPCSFFKYIFINPSNYDYKTYDQIIAHEKIHVNKFHTLDLLLSELAVIALWFNPFIWVLRKEVEKNVEYQTDDILINQEEEIKEGYQLNLVKIASHTKPLAITTNYNQSLIKQRILKMNTSRSNHYNYWKYTFVAPLLFVMMLVLNKPLIGYAQNEDPFSGPNAPLTNEIAENSMELAEGIASGPINVPKSEKNFNQKNGVTTEEQQKAEAITTLVSANDCGGLTQAIRDQDVVQVRELLKKIDPNCIDPDPGYEIIESDEEGLTIKRWHPRTPLGAAARVGNLEIGKLLLAAGAEIDVNVNPDGTALAEAAHEGHSDFVTLLLGKGADVNAGSRGHGLALSAAANNGQTKIVALLLNKGAKVNAKHEGHGSALNAASWNGHTETAELLLQKGAEVNLITGGHGSALNGASWNGHNETVELLLQKGADVNLTTGGHGSALNGAAWNGHDATVKLLIEKGANVNLTTGGHGSALNSAAWNGNNTTAALLIEKGADVNLTTGGHGSALNSAAWNGHDATVKLLIEKEANVNLTTGGHGSALNSAAWNGHDATVALLIKRGADVNLTTGGHGSALNSAAWNGQNKTVLLLLEKGADVNLLTGGHGSALHSAAWNGHLETVKLLVSKGADMRLRSGHGTAASAAYKNGHKSVVKYLESVGTQ